MTKRKKPGYNAPRGKRRKDPSRLMRQFTKVNIKKPNRPIFKPIHDESIITKKEEIKHKLKTERVIFEHNASRAYKIVNTSWLSLSILPFKADMIQSFMILLDKPILKSELESRLELAFGDLKCLKK